MSKKTAHELCLRLNAREYIKLKMDAERCGLSRSVYLRRLIMRSDIKARPPKEIQILYAEINKIGSNINQIARSVNAGIASPEDARRGLFMLDRVYEKLNEAVDQWR